MTTRSPQHQDWINRGRPDSGLALPLAELRDVLRAAGFTVYDWPDDSHLDAEPPEDHTQYSETGWPKDSPKWWRHAIDIMPRNGSVTAAAELYDLGNRIYLDRDAGKITWLKYLNTPAWRGKLDQARQYAWEPGLKVRSSSDVGHIHLSCITGVERLSSPYNPLIAAGVDGMTHTIDEVYDTLVGIANGQGPTAGGNSAVADWVKTMQSYGPKLDALAKTLNSVATDVATLKSAVAALQGGAGAGAPATGDVTVTGTLHLG